MSGSDLTQTVRHEDAPPGRGRAAEEPFLFLVLECARPLAGGARVALRGVREVVFGRGPARTIASAPGESGRRVEVRVPDPRMSSSHARLVRGAGGWELADDGSTNGTHVNGARVKRATLADGDVLELGASLFRFRAALRAPDASPDVVESASLAGRDRGVATLLPSYGEALAELVRVAGSTLPVLLLGESGAGKEVLARTVHALSGRGGPFTAVNCGALPEALVEAQLFGHVKGAFSGAVRDEAGLVRTSHGGTLFLDEIGDLPRPAQAALLRVLQEGEVTPVGAARPVPVDLRVVAATHHRVDAPDDDDGGFRRDLYARLAGFTHEVPPLRDRREDLGLILAELLPKVAPGAALVALDVALGRALLAYEWPLNVRELRHALAAAAVLAAGAPIAVGHVPSPLRDALARARFAPRRAPRATAELTPEAESLRDALVTALRASRGNVSEVARAMGKTRMQIHRWAQRFAIDLADYRDG